MIVKKLLVFLVMAAELPFAMAGAAYSFKSSVAAADGRVVPSSAPMRNHVINTSFVMPAQSVRGSTPMRSHVIYTTMAMPDQYLRPSSPMRDHAVDHKG